MVGLDRQAKTQAARTEELTTAQRYAPKATPAQVESLKDQQETHCSTLLYGLQAGE